jgi:hypothetical protein
MEAHTDSYEAPRSLAARLHVHFLHSFGQGFTGSDLQVVEAAIMAQQEGLAPTTTGALPPASAST